jgi:phosphatidate cytidylyltransferase
VLIGLVFKALFLPQLGPGTCVMLGVGTGFLGQFGDFSESMLKRSAQVKDSGSLLPGHGGILDRLDSFLFASPFLYHALSHLVKETP